MCRSMEVPQLGSTGFSGRLNRADKAAIVLSPPGGNGLNQLPGSPRLWRKVRSPQTRTVCIGFEEVDRLFVVQVAHAFLAMNSRIFG